MQMYMSILVISLIGLVLPQAASQLNDCLSVELLGRMGNLMFEYASLVGVCTARGLNYTKCAHISNAGWNTWDLPVQEFIHVFSLPIVSSASCNTVNRKTYREKSYVYDPTLLQLQYGTTIQGYLQSHKYFHPHAEKALRSIYTVPEVPAHRAENFINNIRSHVPAGMKLIGVHVRLGDKINNQQNVNFYNQWSLSEAYYMKAIKLLTLRHPQFALIFFSGGGENNDGLNKDRHWTKQHFSGLSNYTFFDHSDDHFVSFKALGLCDAIVVGHSSFSWWSAYLSDTMEIIAPYHLFSKTAEQTEAYSIEDYYLPWWSLLSEDPSEDRIVGPNLL